MKRYSLNRRDKKLAGVCSTFGEVFNVDPTFLRIGVAAVALFISFKLALVMYVAGGIYLHFAKRAAIRRHGHVDDVAGLWEGKRPARTSIHDLRTKLDVNDRRMMAIDHHLTRQNDDLAREIEALRGE